VLASNQIEFKPALPAAWREAIESLPMGRFVKVAIQFDRDIYGEFRDDIFIYLEKPSTFICIVTGMDDHRMAVAYICGALANEIEQMSEQDARDFILDRLENVFGLGIREHVVGSLCTRWESIPMFAGVTRVPGRGKPTLAPNSPRPWAVASSSLGKRHPRPTMVSRMELISRARRQQGG
jgi:monoamine oxidase